MMAPFWPRVGVKKKDAIEAVWRKRLHQNARVSMIEADIAQILSFDEGQRLGDSVQKDLGSEIAGLRTGEGLGGEVLPAAKADLEP